MDREFWISVIGQTATYAILAYLTGLLVKYQNVRVNYTRKINFFALFLVPLVFGRLFPHHGTLFSGAVRILLGAAIFLICAEPIRSRVGVIQTMFSAFDRPEDRPHTLFWLSSQIIVGYLVLIPMTHIFAQYGFAELMFIPVLVHGIGDGLAEPVGIRFGRHKYSTRALFSKDRRYTRSLEGSACLFVTGLLSVLLFHGSFTPAQFIVALLVVPIIVTLAEAWAPHTWDTPYMFLAGSLSLLAIKLWI